MIGVCVCQKEKRRVLIHHIYNSSSRKERPSSLASISSEDSVNLEDLINANFTTDMDDETDLSALASLELDDSNEEFWKIDNVIFIFVAFY
jgi:hypothetical protein